MLECIFRSICLHWSGEVEDFKLKKHAAHRKDSQFSWTVGDTHRFKSIEYFIFFFFLDYFFCWSLHFKPWFLPKSTSQKNITCSACPNTRNSPKQCTIFFYVYENIIQKSMAITCRELSSSLHCRTKNHGSEELLSLLCTWHTRGLCVAWATLTSMCKRYASLFGFQAHGIFFALRTIDSSANSCYGVDTITDKGIRRAWKIARSTGAQ